MGTVNLGAGLCGMGSSRCGFGTPASIDGGLPPLLRTSTGHKGEAVKLDSVTGDYVLDGSGQKLGDNAVNQMVYLALRTRLGSSAVLNLGIADFPDLITDDIVLRVQAIIRDALAALVRQGLVELVNVDVKRVKTTALSIQVNWINKTTGTKEFTEIPASFA